MPKIFILDDKKYIEYEEDKNLMDILLSENIFLDNACNGKGICGKCKIKIIDGDLEEISEGNWIYWVEPQDAANFMTDNTEIFAELYRTDSADALTGGQRLVSDTFKIAVPDKLPEIVLSSGTTTTRSKSNVKTFEIKENVIEKITETR